jgi:hypothetical protein
MKSASKWKRRSPWREFAFVFRQVTQAIIPQLGLGKMIQQWQQIAEKLKEAPRKRKTQAEVFLL